MLTFLSSQISVILGLFALLSVVFGPRAWPSIQGWLLRIYNAITYPLKGTQRQVTIITSNMGELKEQHVQLGKKLDLVLEQFNPNGGSSIRDSLNRIEAKQATNESMSIVITNSMDIPMFKANAIGECTWASKAYLKITGRTLEDTLGWGWILAIHPDDEEKVRNDWVMSLQQKRQFEKKFRVIDSEGITTKVHCRATPNLLNNSIVSWVGSWEELDERT